MKLKKAVSRVAAVTAGALLMGATIGGALAAADLESYPAPFVQDGRFNALIVVGEQAEVEDVVGAIDIATSLQYANKRTATIESGGSETVSLSGDTVQISRSSDLLEIGENLGDVKETLTSDDLQALASGTMSTSKGTTDYNQYLRFLDSFNVSVVYTQAEDDEVGDFLRVLDGEVFFQYEIEFEQGLDSDVDAQDQLEDLEDEELVMFGSVYSIIDTSWNASGNNNLVLELVGGDVTDTLEEGETKTYTIDGQDFEVTVLIISDTANNGGGSVKFRVNGEVSDEMGDGDTERLSDGTTIGVRDILPNEAGETTGGDIVEFFLGANKVILTDNPLDNAYSTNGVEIEEENIEDAQVRIKATYSNGDVEISNIRYELTADAIDGDVEVFPGEGVREKLDEPEGMLSPTWDINYEGLTNPGYSPLKFDAKGDDTYELVFTTMENLEYKVPYLENDNGVWSTGDKDDNLHWIEENASYSITDDDWFVLTDKNTETGYTRVMRYDSIDTSNREITFSDLAGGTKEITYDATTRQADLVVGGNTYLVEKSNSNTNLKIDLNGDGDFDLDEVKIVVKGGGILDLGAVDNWSHATSIAPTLTTLSSEFDENPGNEVVTITLINRSNSELGITSLSGNAVASLTLNDDKDDDDLQLGMTKYGVMVELTDPSGSDQAEELVLQYPHEQVGAQVFVTAGDFSSNSGGGAGVIEYDEIQKIEVGAAVLDSEVSSVSSQNLIVVGGPCANTVAMEIMGNPEPCYEGFEEGKAMVKLYETGGDNVAMLVAGYSAMDTRRATRVISNYADYDLSGDEVVVSGTSLSDIEVEAASME